MQHHILEVNELAQTTPEGAASIARFALLTIRTQFETVPRQVADYLNNGTRSKYVWGYKRTSFAWLAENAATLQHEALRARTDADLVSVFLQVPGLGLAKAGFCAQMFADRVGCLDYLNLAMYNVTLPKFPKAAKPETQHKHVAHYVDLCASLGTSAELWERWCSEVGKRKSWPNGDAVSVTHVNLIRALANAA